MNRFWKCMGLCGCILALMACSESLGVDTVSPGYEVPDDERGSFDHPEIVGVGDAPSRPRSRLDIDQLNASIRQVTGGIGWEVSGVDQFEALSTTLGRPDYANSTTEDLDASPLFQKFLGDAARSVCSTLMQRERSGSAESIMLRHVNGTDTVASSPEAVDQNLRDLLLRFHGHVVEVSAPDLYHWRWLFETATDISGDPLEGWETVCVALITHVDFYTY